MTKRSRIPVLKIRQWLSEWNNYEFDDSLRRRQPEPHIYVFSMPALQLRQLSDVYRRHRTVDNAEGIQRIREGSRTERIRRYVQYGYPFGDLKENLRVRENWGLRKPGWLPTAIVVNVLTPEDERRGKSIDPKHLAKFAEQEGRLSLDIPDVSAFSESDLRPFEIIDGQHRLWAFGEQSTRLDSFDLPVVAFLGLDIAWQAYLFWSINISPKRINPSHAFDLYPLLRTQDWLEKTNEIAVYREARAQEIVEWLYRLQQSPWYGRINMLGVKGEARVSQAAWVRSLIGSFFGTGKGRGRFGLFQASIDNEGKTLSWIRPQQVAFLLEFWIILKSVVEERDDVHWIKLYRETPKDPFTDRSSMLNQDMGVRAVHSVVNDIFFLRCLEWKLEDWSVFPVDEAVTDVDDINQSMESLRKSQFRQYMLRLARATASFDWRSLDGPGVRESDGEIRKRAFRGSGGYTLLVKEVLEHVAAVGHPSVANAAVEVLETEYSS